MLSLGQVCDVFVSQSLLQLCLSMPSSGGLDVILQGVVRVLNSSS